MRLLILTFAFLSILRADAGIDLTELEIALFQKTAAQRDAADTRHQAELAPILAEQNKLMQKICERLGVPKDKMLAECKIDIDFDSGRATRKPAPTAKELNQ